MTTNRGYQTEFNEDRPTLARIKALALRTKRVVGRLSTTQMVYTPLGGTTLYTKQDAPISAQLHELYQAHEAATELEANLAQRIRALKFDLAKERAS